MSRFKAVCNTGIEKDYYTFDGGWHTIKHPGYYITQYMRATGKTTREMTQWVKTSDTPGGHTYAKMTRKELRALRRGRARVTPAIAEALRYITGIPAKAWLSAQETWDEVSF